MDRLRHVIHEIHRRSIWQVLGIYVVGSWVGYQVVISLTQGLGLPDWVPGFAVVLFIIGLPIVLATAFVQEGLPGGGQRATGDGVQPVPGAAQDPGAQAGATSSAGDVARAASGDVRLSGGGAASGADRRSPAAKTGARPAGVWLTWGRAIGGGALAFLLLGVTAGGYVGLRNAGVGPFASLVTSGKLDEQANILIADFHSPAGDTAIAALVTEAFRIDFARSTLVRAVDPVTIRESLRRMDRADVRRLDAELAREMAIREGYPAYVAGDVTPAAGGYVLSARLYATESGEVLAALRETARTADDLIESIDRLSRALRERTGESVRVIRRGEPLAQVTTSSLEALQKYTRAQRASSWDGNPTEALQLMREAVALDSAFAAAHYGISIYLGNRFEIGEALTSVETALRHRDRLTEVQRHLAQAHYHGLRREHALAIAALERAIAIQPDHAGALNNLGIRYSSLGDYGRAEIYLRRSIEVDTTRFFGYANLGENLVHQGRFEEAEATFDRARRMAPQSAWPVAGHAVLPYLTGDYDGAEARLQGLLTDPATSRAVRSRAEFYLASLLRARGRLVEGDRRLTAAALVEATAQEAERWSALRSIVDEIALLGRPEQARRRLDDFRARHGAALDTTQALSLAELCGWVGDAACAREQLRRVDRDGPAPEWAELGHFAAQAALAYAEGRPTDAIRELRRIQDRGCPYCEEPLVARIFESMGQPDSAIAAYDRFVSTPALHRIAMEFMVAPSHYRLGGLYEERGDMASAVRHYARFTEIWANADPVLQPQVAAARGRLVALRGDR